MKKIITLVALFFTVFTILAQTPLGEKFSQPEQISVSERKARLSFQQSVLSQHSVSSQDFDVNFYRCEWEVDPAIRFIKGSVTSYFTIIRSTNSITYDLHAALTVDSIRFRGNKISFEHTANHGLTIQLVTTLNVNQKDSLTIYYQGIPANDGYGSFATSLQSAIPVMWTLSEPYGAKDWWPCKNGLDDKADSIDILITCPDLYYSSSNGLLINQWNEKGKITAYWKHRYPIASYLVAIAVTNYMKYTDTARIGNILLPVHMYSYPSHVEYFREPTVIARRFLEIFSTFFGPYPFSKESYSQTQFGWGGGMEHQTNSFIANNSSQLVVHELGHQWFGDKVTCGSWQDIWLNEGFATYMQLLYVENMEPLNRTLHLNNYRNIIVGLPGGSVKRRDTSNINHIFDFRLSYSKASYLVHMIRWKLGDSLFFKAIRQYLNDPRIAYGTARTADLQRNLEEQSGQKFEEFFKDWYEGEGFPSYQVQWSINTHNWVKIKLNQTTSHPSVSFYEMPVPIQFKGAGKDSTLVLNHTQNGEEFLINTGFTADSAFFDPQGWLLSDKNTVIKTISEAVNNNEIKIFPNPGAGNLFVSLINPTGKRVAFQLLNASGQLLYKKEIEITGRDELIQIPSYQFPAGIYWVRVKGDNFNVVKKVVK